MFWISSQRQQISEKLMQYSVPLEEICRILILCAAIKCKTWSTFSFLDAYVAGDSSNVRASPAEKIRIDNLEHF